MALLTRFDPPAFMDDLDRIKGGREAWHTFMQTVFDWAIRNQNGVVTPADAATLATVQFFNPTAHDPGGPIIEQAVTWNAFPKELLVRFGRARALVEADRLWPIEAYRSDDYDPAKPGQAAKDAASTQLYRPHNEYCEWHVDRDRLTGKICKLTFTSEPPEYWQAMFGGNVAIDPDEGVSASFSGDPELVLELYRKLVSPEVRPEDLILAETSQDGIKGRYNPYNKWNTTHGIAHLAAPPNSLGAEVRLGADATILRGDTNGRPIARPDALVCCAGFGGPERNSDPTIGSTVNALARAGAMITLVNPVGLYMDHIDVSGWEMPDGINPSDCISITRGTPSLIERMVVEMPPGSRHMLGDMTIGGEPLRYGGQIAECITVKLVGGAAGIGTVRNGLTRCPSRCCIDLADADRLRDPIGWGRPTPIGFVDALLARPPDTTGVGGARHLAAGPTHLAAVGIQGVSSRRRRMSP
jgi:hypothetical protein